jgi:hypothetical protein
MHVWRFKLPFLRVADPEEEQRAQPLPPRRQSNANIQIEVRQQRRFAFVKYLVDTGRVHD